LVGFLFGLARLEGNLGGSRKGLSGSDDFLREGGIEARRCYGLDLVRSFGWKIVVRQSRLLPEARSFANSAARSYRSSGVFGREDGRMVGDELVSKRHKRWQGLMAFWQRGVELGVRGNATEVLEISMVVKVVGCLVLPTCRFGFRGTCRCSFTKLELFGVADNTIH